VCRDTLDSRTRGHWRPLPHFGAQGRVQSNNVTLDEMECGGKVGFALPDLVIYAHCHSIIHSVTSSYTVGFALPDLVIYAQCHIIIHSVTSSYTVGFALPDLVIFLRRTSDKIPWVASLVLLAVEGHHIPRRDHSVTSSYIVSHHHTQLASTQHTWTRSPAAPAPPQPRLPFPSLSAQK
jgi:hypothetical protein